MRAMVSSFGAGRGATGSVGGNVAVLRVIPCREAIRARDAVQRARAGAGECGRASAGTTLGGSGLVRWASTRERMPQPALYRQRQAAHTGQAEVEVRSERRALMARPSCFGGVGDAIASALSPATSAKVGAFPRRVRSCAGSPERDPRLSLIH